MKNILYLVIICAVVLGCHSTKESQKRPLLHTLTYYKDPRTNLCFAGALVWHPAGLLTNVPCTPQVEELVKYYDE